MPTMASTPRGARQWSSLSYKIRNTAGVDGVIRPASGDLFDLSNNILTLFPVDHMGGSYFQCQRKTFFISPYTYDLSTAGDSGVHNSAHAYSAAAEYY